MAEPVETDFDAEAAGFFCSCTVAWGMPVFGPAELDGTFAVSFLVSETKGAGAMAGAPPTVGGLGAEGGTEAAGRTGPGGLGAAEGAGGAPVTDGGRGGAAGTRPGAEGGLGTPGATAEGGGTEGAAGAGTLPAAGAPGTGPTGFCTGLGGKLIIAVSRGFDARG